MGKQQLPHNELYKLIEVIELPIPTHLPSKEIIIIIIIIMRVLILVKGN